MQEIFQGRIRDISSEGHGVVDHPSGMVFFVSGAWPGDEGEFVVESRHKKYGSARILKLTKPSPDRETPICPHLGWQEGRCGGCSWMIAKYSSQLFYKQKRIQYLIERNLLASKETTVLPIRGSQKELGYRNRAQFKTDGEKIGYVSPNSKVIAEVKDCVILTDKNRETFGALREQLPKPLWRPKPPYLWNYIDIDEDVEVSAVSLNYRRPFRQANDEQNNFMKAWLGKKLEAENRSIGVIELFAGSGNFTKVFVEHGFKTIYSAELDQHAVQKLKNENGKFVQGFAVDLFKPEQWEHMPMEVRSAELLFLDPPREGFKLLEKYVGHFPKLRKIIYVSCEPYQWSGDIKNLVTKGWTLEEAQPVDQFPQTPHVELLSVLTRST
jgi:23S rRNA (uracil1939-C5)-methyltransferase